ncbi:hypothetical protein [Clostridium psychrophilum]|nr:hypothetical protein [Clostridium psychrophilum]
MRWYMRLVGADTAIAMGVPNGVFWMADMHFLDFQFDPIAL